MTTDCRKAVKKYRKTLKESCISNYQVDRQDFKRIETICEALWEIRNVDNPHDAKNSDTREELGWRINDRSERIKNLIEDCKAIINLSDNFIRFIEQGKATPDLLDSFRNRIEWIKATPDLSDSFGNLIEECKALVDSDNGINSIKECEKILNLSDNLDISLLRKGITKIEFFLKTNNCFQVTKPTQRAYDQAGGSQSADKPLSFIRKQEKQDEKGVLQALSALKKDIQTTSSGIFSTMPTLFSVSVPGTSKMKEEESSLLANMAP